MTWKEEQKMFNIEKEQARVECLRYVTKLLKKKEK